MVPAQPLDAAMPDGFTPQLGAPIPNVVSAPIAPIPNVVLVPQDDDDSGSPASVPPPPTADGQDGMDVNSS